MSEALTDANPPARELNRALFTSVRNGLPGQLNRGILLGDGGMDILGWMLLVAGMHPINLYQNTVFVAGAKGGGNVLEVVGRLYGLTAAQVLYLAEVNDRTDSAHRVEAVAAAMDEILIGGR